MKAKALTGDPKRAVALIRVSTGGQDLGPEAQRDAMAAWCAGQGINLVAVYEERITGTVKAGQEVDEALARRSGLLDAVNGLHEAGAGVFLVQKRDRLARSVLAAAVIEGLVEKQGATILTTEGDSSDPSDPNAFLLRAFKDVIAQFEAMQIAARTRAAMAVKRRRGEWCGGTTHYGERAETAAEAGARGARARGVVGAPEEQEIVEYARRLRAGGRSLTQVRDALEAAGFRTRKGSEWWSYEAVRSMVASVPTPAAFVGRGRPRRTGAASCLAEVPA